MKEKTAIAGLALVAVVLAAAFLFLDSEDSQIPVEQTIKVPFTVLASGTQSSVADRVNYLIVSEEQLHQLWRMVETNETLPTIDFAKNVVIAVFAGTQPTVGYSVAVSRIEDGSASRTVQIALTKPGTSCILAKSETAPFQIIEVPRGTAALSHTDTVSVISCFN